MSDSYKPWCHCTSCAEHHSKLKRDERHECLKKLLSDPERMKASPRVWRPTDSGEAEE